MSRGSEGIAGGTAHPPALQPPGAWHDATAMTSDAPLDADEFDRWRRSADGALSAARVQLRADSYNWACFLAEQAAQLGMKALLHGIGKAPWGHDLPSFGEALHDAGLEVPDEIEDALARLGRHYIPSRYPDAHPSGPPDTHYRRSDTEEAEGDARAILSFVDRTWEKLRG